MLSAPMVYELRKPKQIQEDKVYPVLFLIQGRGSNAWLLDNLKK